MNKLWILAGALWLTACSVQTPQPAVVGVNIDDAEDFYDWLEERGEEEEPLPFMPAPIFVTGVGEVRAAPDIAVITGRIKAEAKADYLAMDEAALITNKIQDQIAGKNISISFTQISTQEKRDEQCLLENQIAQRRHWDIIADNRFNEIELRKPKDIRKPLRPPKPRIAQKVCPVTHVESTVGFTAWVKPAGDVQQYLTGFTEAGADNVTLFGYDFSNYDALYKDAAEKAVANARAKAQSAARIAGTQLTTIESFSVTPTSRTTRFGQQAMIISPHGNRYVPQTGITFAERIVRSRAPGRPMPAPARSSRQNWDGTVEDEIVVTASKRSTSRFSSAEPIGVIAADQAYEAGLVSEPDALYKTNAYSGGGDVPSGSNALRQSMMSGAKVIRVEAQISFSYDTPINGVVFEVEE